MMLKLVALVALAGLVASETPTAPQRANLKLAHDEYRKNTKTSFITAEPLYKKAVVDFSETLGAGHFFTKAAKKRYNFLLAMDSSKLATEQAFACEDSCSPGGTYTGTGDVAGCTANYCDMYKVGADRRNWCSSSASTAVQHNYALEECQKTCGICVGNRQVGKTPYAASELSTSTSVTTHQGRCASALPTSASYTAQSKRTVNPDMAGSVVLVDCAAGLVKHVEGDHVVVFLSCDWNATTTLYEWAAHGTCGIPCTPGCRGACTCDNPQYVFQDRAALSIATNLWVDDRAAALAKYGHISTNWDTSKVTSFGALFNSKPPGVNRRFEHFNDNIDAWDTSSVTMLSGMFRNAYKFNQPIGSWKTSKVTSLDGMFTHAHAFNQPLNTWDTSQVKSIYMTFKEAHSFNQDISGWDLSNLGVRLSAFDGANSMTFPVPCFSLSKPWHNYQKTACDQWAPHTGVSNGQCVYKICGTCPGCSLGSPGTTVTSCVGYSGTCPA